MSLFAELKRRNVFRVGAAYLALGWVITQVTATVIPVLNLPATLVPIVVWIGVIGFPCVVVFSWVYELTPEGLKRESEVDRGQSTTHVTSKRLDYIIIAMLGVAILLVAVDRFVPRGAPPAAGDTVGAGLPATGASPGASALPQEPATPAPAAAVDEHSIAVLPFTDMSAAKDQEYMSDGIAEELLNLLAKIPQLQVAARTSSFSYKGTNTKIEQIARELHVAHVLEGSVRKSGNRVRITAQLVRADNGFHLWSDTYDRTLDDIFAVQDEIAGAVAAQLKIKLLGEAPKAKEVDSRAYELFLQARQASRQITAASLQQASALYQQALAIDPAYAAAWNGLGRIHIIEGDFFLRPVDESYKLAREAVDKALAIDPEYAPAHDNLGWIAMYYDRDLPTAARHFEHALALEPTNVEIIRRAAALAANMGRLDAAIAIDQYVVAHDPVNPAGYNNLGIHYLNAGRFDDAVFAFRTALQLSPGMLSTQFTMGLALLSKGEAEAALAAMQQESAEVLRQGGVAMACHTLGRKADSDAALDGVIQKHPQDGPYLIAMALAWRNEPDRAFEWLGKAVAANDAGLAEIVADQRLFANIGNDPRWLPFLRGIGKAPEQLAAISFDVKLPQQQEH